MLHHVRAISTCAILLALTFGLAIHTQADTAIFSNQFGVSSSVSSGWLFQGSAVAASGNAYVQLTSQNSNSNANPPAGVTNQEGSFFQAGSLFYTGSTFDSDNWKLTAEIQFGTGNYFGNAVHADGLTFTWLAKTASTTELLGAAGGLLGLPSAADVKGYSFEFDSNKNLEYRDPNFTPAAGKRYEYTGLETLSGTGTATHVSGSVGTPGGSSVFSSAQVGPDFLATSSGGWLPVSLTCTTSKANAEGVGQADFVLAWGTLISGSASAKDFDSLANSYEFQVSNYTTYQDAYFGFTAATGLYTETHDVRNVTLEHLGGGTALNQLDRGGPTGGGATPELPTWALLLIPVAMSLRYRRSARGSRQAKSQPAA